MTPKKLIIAIVTLLGGLYFLTRDAEKKAGLPERKERITIISASIDTNEFQPDLESYRTERAQMTAAGASNEARIKPDFKGAPTYKISSLRAKVPNGPVDDFGAPFFMPSETAMADAKIFEQELEKHKERSDAYQAARFDELKQNTEVERANLQANVDRAKADGSKSPEEIKRADAALERMKILERVLKGEKVENIPDQVAPASN